MLWVLGGISTTSLTSQKGKLSLSNKFLLTGGPGSPGKPAGPVGPESPGDPCKQATQK